MESKADIYYGPSGLINKYTLQYCKSIHVFLHMNLYKNQFLFLFLPLLLLSCAGSKKSKYTRLPGTWQESHVTIDGSNKDWPSPYPEYDSKASLGYCVSNDRENLYITVETGDLATQLKILKNGLTVWIDKTGKKEEATAINFPLPEEYSKKMYPQSKESSQTHRGEENMQKVQGGLGDARQKKRLAIEDRVRSGIKDVNAYSLQGFKACNMEFPLLERDSCGIVVRVAMDEDNELVWEAVVPFKSFLNKKEIGKGDKGKPISICFETTGSNKPAGQPGGGGNHGGGGGMRPSMGMGGMGGGMHMGGGGMRGGGNRGGGQQSSPVDNDMEQLYKSTKTYKVFGIAWIDPNAPVK